MTRRQSVAALLFFPELHHLRRRMSLSQAPWHGKFFTAASMSLKFQANMSTLFLHRVGHRIVVGFCLLPQRVGNASPALLFKRAPKLMSQKPNSRFALIARADMLMHKTREKVDAGRKLCRLSQKARF